MKQTKPVGISGIGAISAAGDNLEQCIESIFSGNRHPAPPSWLPNNESKRPVFEIDWDFYHPDCFLERETLRTGRLALTATHQAMKNAGIDRESLHEKKVGVIIGTNVGSSMNNECFIRENVEGCDPRISPWERFRTSSPTAAIAREYDIGGPVQTVVNACSAGSDAIGLAASWIRLGLCDIVIAGGADEMYQLTYNGFISLMVSDELPCRPFDKNRNGLNLGEGAAVLILESADSMKKRGKRAKVYLYGYGSASDAWHFTAPRPDGKGLKTAIREALSTSGLIQEDIAFINAHGTGTRDNDRIENVVFHELLPGTPFFSTKGCTGHTLGASGALEAAFTAAFLEKGEIPASIGFREPDPDLPEPPVRKRKRISGSFAMSDTLAFGGNNSVLIFGLPGVDS